MKRINDYQLEKRWKEHLEASELRSLSIESGFGVAYKIMLDEFSYRMEWEDFIRKYDPKLFWTVNFLDPILKQEFLCPEHRENALKRAKILSPEAAKKIFEELLKRVNQRLFGRSKHKYLNGFGCIEFQTCGQPHFHTLMLNNVSQEELEWALDDVLSRAKESERKGREMKRKLRREAYALTEAASEADSIESIDPDQIARFHDLMNKYNENRKIMTVRNGFTYLDRKNMDVQSIYNEGVVQYVTKVLEKDQAGKMFIFDAGGVHLS
ncbi:MAG: hypothetical protein AB7U63_02785 [Porticoccaceae bacterium]